MSWNSHVKNSKMKTKFLFFYDIKLLKMVLLYINVTFGRRLHHGYLDFNMHMDIVHIYF